MKTIDKNCIQCNQTFTALLKEHKRGNAKFCSRKCSSKHRLQNIPEKPLKLPNCKCSNCNTDFYIKASRLLKSKSGLYFCSRLCKDTAQRIGGIREIMPSHYGTSDSKDYRTTAFRYYPNKCLNCGYSKYLSVLEVHHIDRDRTNNSPDNLAILCPTCHTEEHFLSKDGK